MPKFLRTIRLDDSDTRVFDDAAAAGEWAVSGAFAFAAMEREDLAGKTGHAFAGGFLGLTTFGRSTLVAVTEASARDLAQIERRLAEHLVARYGAPSLQLAFPAAGAELAMILGVAAEAPVDAVLTVKRRFDAKGRIEQRFGRIDLDITASPP